MSKCKYEALSATPLGSEDIFVFAFYRHVTTLWSRKRVILTPEESHVYSNKMLTHSFRYRAFLILCSASAQSSYSLRLHAGYGSDNNILTNFSFGKKIVPKLFFGVGTGLNSPISTFKTNEVKGSVLLIPMFVEAQFIPFKTVISPFISIQTGGENTITIRHIDPVHSVVERDYKLVGYFSPAIGLRLRIVNNFALCCKFSSHFRRSSTYSVSRQAYSFLLGMEF